MASPEATQKWSLMKKHMRIILGISAVALFAGMVWYFFVGGNANSGNNAEAPNTSSTSKENTDKPSEKKSSDMPKETIPENTVVIKDFEFSKPVLKIKKGTAVTWINRDDTKHTVTSDTDPEANLDSPYFGAGETFTYTFDTVGIFPYHCAPHPYMKGTVEVME